MLKRIVRSAFFACALVAAATVFSFAPAIAQDAKVSESQAAGESAATDQEESGGDAAKGPVLRVAFPQSEGVSMTDENGVRSGIFYDWLVEVSKYTGWRYEFVEGDVQELMTRAAAGDIDLIGGMYYRSELESKYDYSSFPMGTNHALLIGSRGNDTLSNFDVRTLNGKTIGAFESATEKIRRLDSFLALNNLDCTVLHLDAASYEHCLEDGTADVMLGSASQMNGDRKAVAEFEGEPYYIALPEGSALRAQLDDAMTKIFAADSNFSHDLYVRYFPAEYAAPIEFTQADRDYVAQAKPVDVAVVADQYPLYYLRDGSYQGVAKDVFDRMSERTGLTFRFVHASTYQDALDLVTSGQADVLGWFMDDEHEASGRGLALTKGFATLDDVVLRNKMISHAAKKPVIAQIKGRPVPGDSSQVDVLYFQSYAACLEAVNSGRADYVNMPASYAESLFVDGSYGNLTPATSEQPETSFSVAFPVPVDASLYSVMSKAVNSLDGAELESIVSRNAAPINDRHMSLEVFLSENPLVVVVICLVLLLLVGAIAVVVSVSKVRNRMMEIKLERAEETGRAKTDFLSRMSHEIRTPMNAIIGLSSVASLSGEATPSIHSSLEKINTSAQFLLALVNDILDMSKIENDKMSIVEAPMSLRSLGERLESMFCIQAQDKGLSLGVRCNTDAIVMADDVRLQQVLANLLTNAFKFTDPGGTVILLIDERAREDGRARVRFSVSDDGAGIRDEDLERIFVSFEQAAENRRNAQGTGLGLAISSNLVRLMGGKLEVTSSLGVGSEFFFQLELDLTDQHALEEPGGAGAVRAGEAEPSLEGVRVLLAEDNDLNAEIAVALLEMQGVAVQRASDGREAVDMFARSAPGFFDLILMDVKMPVMDGLEASRAIRGLDRPDARTVAIIALTANTFQEDRQEAAEAGMDDFVPKPFDASQLYNTLRAHVKAREDDSVDPAG